LIAGVRSPAPIARLQKLLDLTGGLAGLARRGAHGIMAYPGIGALSAARVAAALELGRRVLERELDRPSLQIGSVDEVVAWARPRLSPLEHEEVWMLSLDGRNRLKSTQRIAQ